MQPGNSFCSACGTALAPGARFCAGCGATAGGPAAAPGFVQGGAYGGPGGQTTVAATFAPAVLPQAPGNAIPEEILARWSWGPFLGTPLWAFWNGDTLHKVLSVVGFLLSFFTGFFAIVFFGYAIYLGFRGNRIAAANRRFSSLQEFLAVQHAWSVWGVVALIVELTVFAGLFFMLLVFGVFAALVAH
jgi:hypothetical protein